MFRLRNFFFSNYSGYYINIIATGCLCIRNVNCFQTTNRFFGPINQLPTLWKPDALVWHTFYFYKVVGLLLGFQIFNLTVKSPVLYIAVSAMNKSAKNNTSKTDPFLNSSINQVQWHCVPTWVIYVFPLPSFHCVFYSLEKDPVTVRSKFWHKKIFLSGWVWQELEIGSFELNI